MEHKELPRKFRQYMVEQMLTGETAYISRTILTFFLDKDNRLWVTGKAMVANMPEEEIIPEQDDLAVFSNEQELEEECLGPIEISHIGAKRYIKIERMKEGFKLYLHEYFSLLKKKRRQCELFSECKLSLGKHCACLERIKVQLFKRMETLPKEGNFLPIVEYDDPESDIRNPVYLKKLTPELLEKHTDEELQIFLQDSLSDENFAAAVLIRNEIQQREK